MISTVFLTSFSNACACIKHSLLIPERMIKSVLEILIGHSHVKRLDQSRVQPQQRKHPLKTAEMVVFPR
jgi:hypothetical protein